ncbi:MAG: hypothetical protein RSC40_09640, partial [Clostridia bacterium]
MALHVWSLRLELLHFQCMLADNIVGTPYMVSAQLALGVFDETNDMAVHSVMTTTHHTGCIRCTFAMAI